MSFSNKTVIVTGAASGLGKAIAAAFAHDGANTVLCDINKAGLDATVAELKSASVTGQVVATDADITSEESFARVIEAATKLNNGRLDVLVNNAGIMDRIEPAGQCSKDMWDRVIGVNLTGTFVATKHAVNAMLAQQPSGGLILNIGSVGSVKGGVSGAAYTASKHAILGLTKNTAVFYSKKGIRCNAIMPGAMETSIANNVPGGLQSMSQEGFAVIQTNMSMQPALCDVGGVAKLVLSVCGEQGTLLNGACIPADHGWMAN